MSSPTFPHKPLRRASLSAEAAFACVDHEAKPSDDSPLSRLNHPNIESIYSIESDGDIDFLVFELLSGFTLADRIQGPLDQASIVTFGVQIVGTVAAAHQNGVIHRDLKPENIFLTRECGVKVDDFGLARMAVISNNESTQSIEQQGTLVGTLAFPRKKEADNLCN
jgi:eukaryotic-like serine/threonine-protein kinase